MPNATTTERIEAAARAAGFIVLGVDFGHVRVLHPGTGRRVSLPVCVPQRRTLAGTYRDILTRAGQPATPTTADSDRRRRAITSLMSAPATAGRESRTRPHSP